MIMAGQMQHAVEDQNFQFAGGGMTITRSVPASDVRGDGNVPTSVARERKNVRGLVFPAEAMVQCPNPAVSCDQDVHIARDPSQLLRVAGKAGQARPAPTP